MGYDLHVYICIDNDDSFFEEASHEPTVVPGKESGQLSSG